MNEKFKLCELGEKDCIKHFIRPLFNSVDDLFGVGDDCAMIEFGEELCLASTDRVPADLTAFRVGIFSYHDLGDYLARLNLSDIAACGGHPTGLLLNLGLPNAMAVNDVRSICEGFGACAKRHAVAVLGGDMTSASELSISATSLGRVAKTGVLTRRGSRPGDSIFISRSLGMANAALRMALQQKVASRLSPHEAHCLRLQFSRCSPMLELGHLLSSSGSCSSCMDNTDGIGQSLKELSEASHNCFVVKRNALLIDPLVQKVCHFAGVDPTFAAFGSGADFSLVGTLHGEWSTEKAIREFGEGLMIIGKVETGKGVWLEGSIREPLECEGWNYFMNYSVHEEVPTGLGTAFNPRIT